MKTRAYIMEKIAFAAAAVMAMSTFAGCSAFENHGRTGYIIENGAAQPILQYSNYLEYGYSNEDSDNGAENMAEVTYQDSADGLFHTAGKWRDFDYRKVSAAYGSDIREYANDTKLEAGKDYSYTFYMMPTTYTLEEGHKLMLVLTTFDPFSAQLDIHEEFVDYGFTVNNRTLDVEIPVLAE